MWMWTGAVLLAILALAACLGVIFVPIWIALKAKPIGSLPYRWGLHLGIWNAIGSFGSLCLAFSAFGKRAVSEGVGFVILAVLLAVAAVGLCRRKRWGVVVFIVTCAWFLVVPPILTEQASQVAEAVPALALLIVNIVYFKKRWKLMGMSPSSLASYPDHLTASSLPCNTDRKPRKGIIYTDSELEAMSERPPQS